MPNYTIKTKYAGDTAQLIKKLEIPSHSQILKDVSKKELYEKAFMIKTVSYWRPRFYQFDLASSFDWDSPYFATLSIRLYDALSRSRSDKTDGRALIMQASFLEAIHDRYEDYLQVAERLNRPNVLLKDSNGYIIERKRPGLSKNTIPRLVLSWYEIMGIVMFTVICGGRTAQQVSKSGEAIVSAHTIRTALNEWTFTTEDIVDCLSYVKTGHEEFKKEDDLKTREQSDQNTVEFLSRVNNVDIKEFKNDLIRLLQIDDYGLPRNGLARIQGYIDGAVNNIPYSIPHVNEFESKYNLIHGEFAPFIRGQGTESIRQKKKTVYQVRSTTSLQKMRDSRGKFIKSADSTPVKNDDFLSANPFVSTSSSSYASPSPPPPAIAAVATAVATAAATATAAPKPKRPVGRPPKIRKDNIYKDPLLKVPTKQEKPSPISTISHQKSQVHLCEKPFQDSILVQKINKENYNHLRKRKMVIFNYY